MIIRFIETKPDGMPDEEKSIIVPGSAEELKPFENYDDQNKITEIDKKNGKLTEFWEYRQNVYSTSTKMDGGRTFPAIYLDDKYICLWIREIKHWVVIFFFSNSPYFSWTHDDEVYLDGPFMPTKEQQDYIDEVIKNSGKTEEHLSSIN